MVPIVLSMIPTIVGTAMLVGLNDSGKKGALLFGQFLPAFLEPEILKNIQRTGSWASMAVHLPFSTHTTRVTPAGTLRKLL